MTSVVCSGRRLKDALASIAALAVLVLLALSLNAGPAAAQILKRGVQGGVAGAIIGGIVDGGKGAGKGAAIGAGVGAVAGAIERDQNNQRYAAPPPPPPPGPGYAYGGGSLVSQTQLSLTRLGYQPGPVDGVMGPGTSSAIRNYQYAWGLPVTGSPSPQLLDHMRAHGG